MPTIRTRAAKTSALTHNEVDANFTRPSTQKTTTYTILVGDNRATIEGNHASTPFTITLPTVAAAGAAEPGDFRVTVSNINAAAVTLDGSGAELIDGAANVVLEQWDSITVELDSAAGAWKTTSKVGSDQTVQDLTVAGAFTSLGIDDNATSTALTIDSSEDSSFAGKITATKSATSLTEPFRGINATADVAGAAQMTIAADAGEINVRHNASTFTTSGAYRQDGGIVMAGTTSSGGLTLAAAAASSTMEFYTAGVTASELALTLDASQAATFPGTVTSTGALTATAGITSGSDIVSDTDSTDDLGTTSVRWANLFVDDITVTNGIAVPGQLYGLTTAHDTDTVNDVLINVGSCADSTNAVFMNLAAILTKRIDANWAAGDNNGGFTSTLTLTNDTWYHYFLIKHTDGTVDAGWDTNLDASALLTDSSYTYYRRIASHYYGTATIDQYTQHGDTFNWSVPLASYAGAGNTSGAVITLRAPLGIVTKAQIMAWHSADGVLVRLHPTDVTNAAITNTNRTLEGDATQNNSIVMDIISDTSSQIFHRASTGAANLYVNTLGWKDDRGKF